MSGAGSRFGDPMIDPRAQNVTVICGGVGAARLLQSLSSYIPADQITAIVNVGDDMNLHGLHISPDLDTIVYTLAKQVSTERGWGLEGESWQAMEMVGRYGGDDWFALGDRDLGTHLFRTNELMKGATLSGITKVIARAWDLDHRILPVTDNRLRTMVTIADGTEISFQEYFVGQSHSVSVQSVRFEGASAADPAPGVIEAIEAADRVIVAPSNPAVSIDPVLAVPGVSEAIKQRRSSVIAVSPIIGGKALKGPADRLMNELGRESSATGIAEWYKDLIGKLVIDSVDHGLAGAIQTFGIEPIVTETIMAKPGVSESLSETLLSCPL